MCYVCLCEVVIEAVWDEIDHNTESDPRRRLIRLLEIVKGEEEQALLPEKQTAYQKMLHERRRQEHDNTIDHLVGLMQKETRIAAAFNAHFHPDTGLGDGGAQHIRIRAYFMSRSLSLSLSIVSALAPRRCAYSIGILGKGHRVSELLEKSTSFEKPTHAPPPPPKTRRPRNVEDLYADDIDWEAEQAQEVASEAPRERRVRVARKKTPTPKWYPKHPTHAAQ